MEHKAAAFVDEIHREGKVVILGTHFKTKLVAVPIDSFF